MSTFQVSEYLGCGGRRLYTSLRSQVTRGCCPIGTPFTLSCVIDTAEHMELMVRCCKPSSNNKKSKKCFISHEKGSISLQLHQQLCFFQHDWLDDVVPLLCPDSISLEDLSEIPVTLWFFLRPSMWLTGAILGSTLGVGDRKDPGVCCTSVLALGFGPSTQEGEGTKLVMAILGYYR